jgi:hypothetical protein
VKLLPDQDIPGGVDPDEREPLDKPKSQVKLEVGVHKYAELGEIRMVLAPDGGVMLPPGLPPQPADYLTADSFVCASTPERPVCAHYGAMLLPADGIVKGFKQPLQIRRFCTRLAAQSELLELTDSSVYACTLRFPQDPESLRRIEAFEAEQRKVAEETAKTGGSVEI